MSDDTKKMLECSFFIFLFFAIAVAGAALLGRTVRSQQDKQEQVNIEIGRRQVQREAITNGIAQYNPTNGLFEWKR